MIRTEQLTKRFGTCEAVCDMNLDVPEGSVFALVGPNGAGKTTTIKTMMNIFRPTAGRAEVLGVDSTRLRPRELAQIGYVAENQRLPEWMPAGYFLSYCAGFYPSWDGELADSLVRLYDLPLDRKLKSLSRGMRVKAALASSLAYRPRLIVLDEPFSGLDPLVRDELIESLLDRAADATVLISSHDLAEIETFASHIGYMDAGHLQFTEDMATLTGRFREIEVTLERPADLPRHWPDTWLNPQNSSVVVRFTDSGFSDGGTQAEVARLLPGVRDIAVHNLPLRSIVVALQKAARRPAREAEAAPAMSGGR